MFYPNLNESPDKIIGFEPYEHKIAGWDDKDAYAFGLLNDKMVVSKKGDSHGDIFDYEEMQRLKKLKNTQTFRGIWDLPGRIWVKKKLISFWYYPKTNKELEEIIKKIEKKLRKKIWDDPDFKIEINTEPPNRDTSYGEWTTFNEKSVHLIPIKDFKGSEDAAKKEFSTPHKPIESNKGWGSNHPKYQGKQKEKRYMYAESFYPSLNENPNTIIKPEKWKKLKNQGTSYNNFYDLEDWDDTDTIVFSYYNGELGTMEDMTHWDLAQDFKMSHINSGRGDYSGRLFIEYKVITFWQFPKNNEELLKIIADLENATKLNIINDEWVIEVPTKEEGYDFAWSPAPPNANNIEYVSIKDYKNGIERSSKELAMPHRKPESSGGWGSKHPKYQELEKQKRMQPFEGFYPKLK